LMKLKYYATALIPVCLVTFIFRAVELILCIDPRTGEFAADSRLPTVFNVALILFALIFATVLFARKEPKPVTVRLYKATLTDLILGIAAAMTMIASALFGLIQIFFQGPFSLGGLFGSSAFWLFLTAFCAGTFLIFYVTYPKRTVKQNLWKVLSLALTAHLLGLFITHFNDLDVVFSRAFGIYRIAYYGVAAMAAVSLSKILVRLTGRKTFLFFTCMMAVLMALRVADTVLYLIPGNPYSVSTNLLANAADLLLTLLFLSQMKKIMKGKKRRRRPEEELPPENTAAAVPSDDPVPPEALPSAEEPATPAEPVL